VAIGSTTEQVFWGGNSVLCFDAYNEHWAISHLGDAAQRAVGDGTARVRRNAATKRVAMDAAVAALRQVVVVHSRRLVGSGDGVEQRAVSNGAVVVDCTRAVTC
jgi:hypothetical protein